MKQFTFSYFNENDCKAIQRELNGTTFYDFKITYSNQAGNCTLIVSSDYDADVEEIKKAFTTYALYNLATLLRNKGGKNNG